MEQLGELLEAQRLKRKMSQRAAAEHFGIAQQTWSGWAQGKFRPNPALAPRVARWLGLSVAEYQAIYDRTVSGRGSSAMQQRATIQAMQTDIDGLRRQVELLAGQVDLLVRLIEAGPSPRRG